MSYSGFEEYICVNGHYYASDCYDSIDVCPQCNGQKAFQHFVDQTNGKDANNPDTFSADKKLIGQEDVWHTDHLGNKYVVQIPTYTPNSDAWIPCVEKFTIEWYDSKITSNTVPEQDSPKNILVYDEHKLFCKISLPYPAKRCGMYVVKCNECGNVVGIPTTGKVDDPCSITINCK